MSAPNADFPRTRAAAEWFLIGAFLLTLCLPIVGNLLGLEPIPESVENAPPPTFPTLTPDGASGVFSYGAGKVAALQDSLRGGFGFRRSLIRLTNRFEFAAFGRFAASSVIAGRSGWLIYATDGNLLDFLSSPRYTPAELDRLVRAYQDRRDWCAARGIRHLFVLAPSPQTIYPESLPERLTRANLKTRLDQVTDALRARAPGVEVIDLRPALREARGLGRLYHRTDTHWNSLGAYIGYREIVDRLHAWFPGLAPLPLSEFIVTTHTVAGGDLSGMLALRDVLAEEEVVLDPKRPRLARTPEGEVPPHETMIVRIRDRVVSEVPDPRLPKLLMYRDSYGTALMPFLSEHFRQAVYVWYTPILDRSLIERERPDVVIEELTERLVRPPPLPR